MFNKRILIGLIYIFFSLQSSIAQNPEITIANMKICAAIENRQPANAGITFPSNIGQLFCFTQIYSSEVPLKIYHTWYYNGEEISNVELNIGAEAWRTWSSKKIPADATGRWRVEVTAADGVVLKTASFTISARPDKQNTTATLDIDGEKAPQEPPLSSSASAEAANDGMMAGQAAVDINIGKMAICPSIENRQPVNPGSIFPDTVGRLFCFTQVSTSEAPVEIYHIWYHNDEEINRVPLNIGSQSWRTWSAKTIKPERTGRWRVDVATSSGAVIESRSFSITPTEKPAVAKINITTTPQESLEATANTEKTTETKQALPPVTIQKMEVCTAVDNREPINSGDVFSNTIGRLYCFTQLISVEAPYKIRHTWYFEDEAVSSEELDVGSQFWRTWSVRNIKKEQSGNWRVDVLQEDGALLKSVSFVIEPSKTGASIAGRQETLPPSASKNPVTAEESGNPQKELLIGPAPQDTIKSMKPATAEAQGPLPSPSIKPATVEAADDSANSLIGPVPPVTEEPPNPEAVAGQGPLPPSIPVSASVSGDSVSSQKDELSAPAPEEAVASPASPAVAENHSSTASIDSLIPPSQPEGTIKTVELADLPATKDVQPDIPESKTAVVSQQKSPTPKVQETNPTPRVQRNFVVAKFGPALITDVDILLGFIENNAKASGQAFNRKKTLKALQAIILDRRYGRIWLIKDEDEAIGYSTLTFGFSLDDNGSYGILDEFYLASEYRGSDVGVQLLTFVEQEAVIMELEVLHLKKQIGPSISNALYKQLGYQDHDAYFMSKRLKANN